MSNIIHARKALVARILVGDGKASRAQRRAAFDNAGPAGQLSTLIDKLSCQATTSSPRMVVGMRTTPWTVSAVPPTSRLTLECAPRLILEPWLIAAVQNRPHWVLRRAAANAGPPADRSRRSR